MVIPQVPPLFHCPNSFQMTDQPSFPAPQADSDRWRNRHSPKPTSIEDWERSDRYHNSFLIPKDDVLDDVVKNSTEEGLPDIAISKAQGKFLNLVAKSIGAKNILEVGTLGG